MDFLRKFFKQLFCPHHGTAAQTEVHFDRALFMVSTKINCTDCLKVIFKPPHAKCCYVEHLHAECMREYFFKQIRDAKQE